MLDWRMSDFEIEIGKHGLEVEAKGKALFWIVTATFLTGLAVGVYVGYKGGHKIDKFKKRWCHACIHEQFMNICIAYSFLRLLALWRHWTVPLSYMYCTCVYMYKHTHVTIHISNVVLWSVVKNESLLTRGPFLPWSYFLHLNVKE